MLNSTNKCCYLVTPNQRHYAFHVKNSKFISWLLKKTGDADLFVHDSNMISFS